MAESKTRKNSEYLKSTFNNKVTNSGKNRIWAAITLAINSLGHEVRTVDEVKHKWKNLSAVAKTLFNEFRKIRSGTGGGPAPAPPSSEVMKTIDLLKDSTSFRGLEGVSTFNDPNASRPLINYSESEESSEQDVPVASSSPIKQLKRKRVAGGEDNRDVQLRVLKKEEKIQNLKMENINLKE